MNHRKETIEAFKLHELRNGKFPISIFKFCEDLNIEEKEFYAHFNSFSSVEKAIWVEKMDEVVKRLNADENVAHFTTFEKWLTFMFTLLESLNEDRSYVLYKLEDLSYQSGVPQCLSGLKPAFKDYVNSIINKGMDTEEIAKRPIITSKYYEIFWIQFIYILKVWMGDESEDLQTTDAAVEKTSMLIFEMLKKGPGDLLVDFIKFAYQQRAY